MSDIAPEIEIRFWQQVDVRGQDDCWPWTGTKTAAGYGRPMINGRRILAHRLSLQISTGVSGKGSHALHSCDNPICVNPAHLRWGTQVENVADRVERNRNGAARGPDNGSAKLTEAEVAKILTDERFIRIIARDYGVSQQTVSAIKNRKIWRHVDGLEANPRRQADVPDVQPHKEKQEGPMLERH